MAGWISREQILAVRDLTIEEVEVDAWGGTIGVRVMTGAERDRFEGMILDAQERGQRTENFRARLLSLCLCDQQGGRLFDTLEIDRLGEKSCVALDQLFDVARRLNKLSPDEVDKLQGNSVPDLNGASGSDSPAI
jgi:hypothetical protein